MVNPRSLQFDPEIEKTTISLRKIAKERKEKEASSSTEPKEETMADNIVLQNPPRTLGDYMTLARVPQTTSIVRPNVDANNFELKPALLQLIQKDQFAGGSTEDPYIHLENFLLYFDTLKMNGVSRDAILLRVFPCSLKEEARGWLQSLPQGSITNWDDLATKFLARFFSSSKMETSFEQKESESLYEAWERFKGLLCKCPQHGFEAWEKGQIFFQEITPNTRTLNEQILQINKRQQAQLDALTKQFSNSQVSSVNTPQVTYGICASAHATEGCDFMKAPENAEDNEIWYDQKNQNNPGRKQYGNNYNQGWKNQNQHSEFSYKSNHQLNPPPLVQQQGNTSEWEKAFEWLSKTTSDYIQNANAFREDTSAFMHKTRASFRNKEASIWNLETHIGQLSRQFAERTQGTFSSNILTNPKAQCKAITTRSGIVILPMEKPSVEKKKDEEPAAEEEEKKDAGEYEKSIPEKKLFKWEKKKALDRKTKPVDPSPYARVPYPQRLKQDIQKQQYTKFLEIFKKLQVNISFAEALESMSNYAKFMKDLLSRKRKLKEGEIVALTEECSAIIQKKLPPKLKDPGSFSISIEIGNIEVGKALCDLGASINLMTLSICKALGIKRLKPTTVPLQLTDRSIRRPDGVIEDVLVKIDKFIFPADFVILNMEEDAEIPLLFGRPFLATARATINVKQRKLMLRMNEKTVTIDVFEFMKHPYDG
ncbi:uncharacterized protein LOC133308738 [Gastrolobium bilobum]|uniref:uncharacterized protein LOC133308738 n=1 Tax=Gastrolobium bilobum TaxID=150636 RepID=UPI002AB1EC6A|nr:uncharacterized protein LOC133308738 [Gastrolobium bilobum]